MQETVRYCDVPIKKRGELVACGERVPDDEATPFALGNGAYEADLCEGHREKLSEALAVYIQVARPVRASNTGQQVRKALKSKKGTFTTKDVRRWLAEQGRDVAPTGRLPNELIEEFRAAHASN